MRSLSRPIAILLLAAAVLTARAAEPAKIIESARQIPVAYDVDVAVVGGGSGAVAAAVAAAQGGAKVFLAAPRPYLGEDLCATMRLWLEPDEVPTTDLAKTLFSEKNLAAPPSGLRSLKFSYTADLPSSSKHKDTPKPSRLNDGNIGRPEANSVQYDGDVTLTADLGTPQKVDKARLVFFVRGGDFSPGSVAVQTSPDGKTWTPAGTEECRPGGDDVYSVALPLGAVTRFVQFKATRAKNAQRLLLAEIALEPEAKEEKVEKPALFGPFRPIMIKKALDDALLAAGVQYLYGCYATELLRDAAGNPCGIVMANRAGRQAVRAKVIIDASDRAIIARMAGAKIQPYPAGPQTFKYIVIGGPVKSGAGITAARKVGLAYATRDFVEGAKPVQKGSNPVLLEGNADIIEYTLQIPMADGSFASFARAEQTARDLTYDLDIKFNTDEIFQVPPDIMDAARPARGEWKGVEKLDLGAFQPAGVERLYVLGGCADLPRDQAEKLLRPAAILALGERIGAAAAAEAKKVKPASEIKVAGAPDGAASAGEVKEILKGVRPTQKGLPTVESPERGVPVLGSYDVVVVGGGTGGAPAGISAARYKGKTLVIEYLHGLGGVGTLGLISKYYHGYRGGFNKELPDGADWQPLDRMQWWRAELLKAGGELWFGAVGCGSVVENNKVTGVMVATPQGRGVVLAKVVIDASGNSDIAAAAGARTVFVDGTEPAVQGTGLPAIKPGSRYTNTDFTIVDETDMLDTWHVLVYAKNKYLRDFDLGQLIDTRERRRVVGDFYMTLPDAINGRTYPDTVCIAKSNFDTHGMTVDPYLLLDPPDKSSRDVNVPYRCLLPAGLEGMMVTGLSMSAHRDVMPLLRMQPDVQNMGYAAGMIAAEAAHKNQPLRQVDLPAIQKELAKLEIIPAEAVGARDSYPLPAEKIAAAIEKPVGGQAMAVIVSHSNIALPMLREKYKQDSSDQQKLNYARILSVLQDPTGVETMIKTVDSRAWDKGWNYTGGGQFGSSMSEVDMLIVAMARTKDKRCLGPIFRKIEQLNEQSEFSHFRAIALALETIGDPAAAGPLAELLQRPGMQGYVWLSPGEAAQQSGPNPSDNSTRSTSIRELTLGRALYRCGDKDGLGKKILETYTKDLRGYLARHAQAVLDGKPVEQ